MLAIKLEMAKSFRSIMRELREVTREARGKKAIDDESVRKLIAASAMVYEVFLTMMTLGSIDPKEIDEEEEELFKALERHQKSA
ncbi:MAG: hypothetical protein AOA65_0168 [Candidatus Bathyarchaeota archaeon BA1]|nr:MAG: hypothetical protein AOA65_0168 [Candidatus Bathyarchaeota archaeon BA1]